MSDATVAGREAAAPWPAWPAWPLLDAVVGTARVILAGRVRSVHAIGSVAHGGFAPEVSDVDVAILLEGPLFEGDGALMDGLKAAVAARAVPLADRLSIFWGNAATVRGDGGGRLPAFDRADLLRHGRSLAGRALPVDVEPPSHEELAQASAAFALDRLDLPGAAGRLADPARLVGEGRRELTRAVLVPVRLAWTAETGEVGAVGDAVSHYAATRSGPAAELAEAALRWREGGPVAGGGAALLHALPLLYVEVAQALARVVGPRSAQGRALSGWAARVAAL